MGGVAGRVINFVIGRVTRLANRGEHDLFLPCHGSEARLLGDQANKCCVFDLCEPNLQGMAWSDASASVPLILDQQDGMKSQ